MVDLVPRSNNIYHLFLFCCGFWQFLLQSNSIRCGCDEFCRGLQYFLEDDVADLPDDPDVAWAGGSSCFIPMDVSSQPLDGYQPYRWQRNSLPAKIFFHRHRGTGIFCLGQPFLASIGKK